MEIPYIRTISSTAGDNESIFASMENNNSPSFSNQHIQTACAIISQNNLFRPERHPYQEVPPQLPSAPQRNHEAEIGRFALIGILPIEGTEKAIVVGNVPGVATDHWGLAPGDSLPGYSVKNVGLDRITLVADGREFLLFMSSGGPADPRRTNATPWRAGETISRNGLIVSSNVEYRQPRQRPLSNTNAYTPQKPSLVSMIGAAPPGAGRVRPRPLPIR